MAAQPYDTEESYAERVEQLTELQLSSEAQLREVGREAVSRAICPAEGELSGMYGRNLLGEVHRYTHLLMDFAPKIQFDVIHAHDWMTFPAALAVAGLTHKPLVVHVHSTEFDRSGERVNQHVYDIERAGMHGASHVVVVSNLTKSICMARYGVPEEKITVVYNAVELKDSQVQEGPVKFNSDQRLVLFLGRITMQKGPEYFVAAAKKVLEKMSNVKFVMAGNGDMFARVIELAANLGIGHKIFFTGFLRGDDVQKIFRMADLFVMPSVSEPFGLVPLEAMSQNVPVIISKQSGVSEVVTHALKVDFWDINEMANKIIAVLRHAPLRETLKKHAHFEVRKFSWHDASQACLGVYEKVTGRA
jgi:glycosyltransferase involved in cell wall biosynthesis